MNSGLIGWMLLVGAINFLLQHVWNKVVMGQLKHSKYTLPAKNVSSPPEECLKFQNSPILLHKLIYVNYHTQ